MPIPALGGRLLRFRPGKTADEANRVLRGIVNDAARWVPFYRDLYRSAGVDVGRFDGIEDLPRLPAVTKEQLLRSPEADRLRKGRRPRLHATTSTSGTSGQPLRICLSQAELYFRRYAYLLGLRRFVPLRFPLRMADVGPMVPHRSRSVEQRLGVVSILRIPGTWPLWRQREALVQYRPTILEGYPTCLELLAEDFAEHEARKLGLRLVVSRGETLVPAARGLLQHVFGSTIANLYSSEEMGPIAWECPDHIGRFHVNHDTCVCEIARRGSGEGLGDVTITNLFNRTMPLIRYQIGDTAERLSPEGSACSCGGGRWLEGFESRVDDFVRLPDGRRVSPRVPGNLVYNALRSDDDPHVLRPEVRRYQIVQDETFVVHVRLQSHGVLDQNLSSRVRSVMAEGLPELPCTVEEMDAPELTAAGKFKIVISRAPDGR